MIKMAFDKLTTDPETQDQLVWLRSLESDERFPLPIDGAEALAIYLSLTRTELPLPLEHDATEEILARLDAQVEEIQILDLDEYGVYTEVVIGFRGGKLRMEVCPGDGIALALKYSAPIYLSEHLTPADAFLSETAEDEADHFLESEDLLQFPPEAELLLNQDEIDAIAWREGLAAASDLDVSDAIDDLLDETGIDGETGNITPDREAAMESLSDQLRDAIRRERYEEAGRLMAEILRMERGEAV
jgi:uncharacterized protein